MEYEQESTPMLDSDQYETQISKEFKHKRPVAIMRQRLDATSLFLPRAEACPERHLVFKDMQHKDKAFFYRIVVAAYNYAFTNEFAAITAKMLFNYASYEFVGWLNAAEVTNPYKILKDYEAHMFDKLNNHGGQSKLTRLKPLFTYAINDEEFYNGLSPQEATFLVDLKATRVSPNLNKKQISLASYFGGIDWLRDDNVGVGSKLYNVFASPKLTINSLKCVTSTVILELYEAKKALRTFLSECNLMSDSLDVTDFKLLTRNQKSKHIGQVIYNILCAYHELTSPSSHLQRAMALLLLSNVLSSAVTSCQKALEGKEGMKDVFLTSKGNLGTHKLSCTFKITMQGPLMSVEVLQHLSIPNEPLPITEVERLMFSWLMVSLTVQPSDIANLNKGNFRLFKVGDKVTHVECEYFKGRANAIHNTRTLSVKKGEGKALLAYLNQHSGNQITTFSGDAPSIRLGNTSILGGLFHALNLPFMEKALCDAHQQFGETPMIMPKALKSLIHKGVHTENIPKCKSLKKAERRAIVLVSDTPCQKKIFGLQAIKNSAVHAYSDPYTLHYLINRNSHTNQTEKVDYLNAENGSWMDAAGRVTRSVMLDLINNVFDLDFAELEQGYKEKTTVAFNNEFASVTNAISYKSEEMLSRLKVVTEQGKGVINEVGVMSSSANGEGVFAPIYVLDSPATVCQMRNYVHEFKENYKQLLSRNPDYLYQTVLPTVEWVEQVLSKLSKDSVSKGSNLFEQMHCSGVSLKVFHSI
jgi:hypothetical protein